VSQEPLVQLLVASLPDQVAEEVAAVVTVQVDQLVQEAVAELAELAEKAEVWSLFMPTF
jgi:hypothetical protein